MHSHFRLALTAALSLALATTVRAQFDAKVVESGKAGVALLEIPEVTVYGSTESGRRTYRGRRYGTAVCVSERGLFVTCAHLFDGTKEGPVNLILNANRPNERVVQARLVRRDEVLDLAALLVSDEGATTPIPLGDAADVRETMEIALFGYPTQTVASPPQGYAEVRVAVGRVTGLRLGERGLDRIALDLNSSGGSGAATLDAKGRLVGIANLAQGYVIPAPVLQSFLDRPQVEFVPPTLDPAKPYDPLEFRAKIVPLFDLDDQYDVVVRLTDPATSRSREAKGKPDREGNWSAALAPAERPVDEAVTTIAVRAEFAHGRVEGRLADRAISVGGDRIRLAELRRLELGESPTATTVDGRSLTGPLGGLGSAMTELGGAAVDVDLSQARAVEFEPVEDPGFAANYELSVLRGDEVVHRSAGALRFAGADLSRSAPALPIPRFDEGPREIALPGPASDVVVGGGGRYLTFVLPSAGKATTLDVVKGELLGTIPLPSNDVRLAAGAEKLFLHHPETNLIERYDLATLRREASGPLPVRGIVKALAMGSATTGPLLVLTADGTDALDHARFQFLDPRTYAGVDYGPVQDRGYAYRDQLRFRVSSNGETFGFWNEGISPSGINTLTIGTGRAAVHYAHETVGAVVPGPDGTTLYCGSGGIYTSDLKRKNDPGKLPVCLPTYHPAFYLAIEGADDPAFKKEKKSGAPPADTSGGVTGSLTLADTGEVLLPLPSLPELAGAAPPPDVKPLTLDQRIHYLVQSDLLVTLHASNDRATLRRFAMKEELEKTDKDYLFVESIPPRTARRGQRYEYDIVATGRGGEVEAVLESGPDGMTVSEGTLRWRIPRNYDGVRENVILRLRSASGRELLHSFRVVVD